MKEVYKTKSIIEAELLKSILSGDNIKAEVFDENLSKMSGLACRIMVSDEDEKRALEIINDFSLLL